MLFTIKRSFGFGKLVEEIVYPDIVSTKQMQEMLHIGRNTAYKLLEGNAVSSIKIGRTHKILKTDTGLCRT